MKNKLLLLLTLFCTQNSLTALDNEFCTTGSIYPSSRSTINTQVTGKIERIYVDLGQCVKKDQPLVQLDSRSFEIEKALRLASLDAAKIELEDAKLNFFRMQKLWEKPEGEAPSIPLKRYEEAKIKYERALILVKEAQENLNKAELNLKETTIKCPIEGIITRKNFEVGESVTAQPVTNILEVQTLQPLYLEFNLPQNYCGVLKENTTVSYEIEGVEANNSEAKIHLFYPALDEQTRSLRCRAIIDNPDLKIRPGSLAKVKIIINDQASNP